MPKTAEEIAERLMAGRQRPFAIPADAKGSILTAGKTYQGDIFYSDIWSACESAGNKAAHGRVCQIMRTKGFLVHS